MWRSESHPAEIGSQTVIDEDRIRDAEPLPLDVLDDWRVSTAVRGAAKNHTALDGQLAPHSANDVSAAESRHSAKSGDAVELGVTNCGVFDVDQKQRDEGIAAA